MDSLGYWFGDGSDMSRRVLGISLSRPQNLKIWNSACDAVLEIGPEWRWLRRPRRLDAAAETSPEVVNVAA